VPKPPGNGRWPPFEVGNSVALRHGAYAVVALARRAAELRPELEAQLAPAVRAGGFGAAIDLATVALARCEAAARALEGMGDDDERLPLLDQRLNRWVRTALPLLEALGATPKAAAAAGSDLAAAHLAAERTRALEEGRELRLEAERRLAVGGGDGVVVDTGSAGGLGGTLAGCDGSAGVSTSTGPVATEIASHTPHARVQGES
jgi:hypothetical protein